jgi:chemotaxis methyl-accepting protein methylase
MTEQLEQLADLVRERSGIALHGEQRIDALAAALGKLAPGMDAAGALRAASDPDDGPRFVTALLEAVAVHETFFFRQRQDLDAIDWRQLLANAQIAGSPRIRIWVAACSTGEEAYTLAILAAEEFGGDPPVAILATDLSRAALARAQAGRYAGRSVRHVEHAQRERWFEREGRDFAPVASLRRHVTFRQHNLVTDAPPSQGFDLIVCRNVLIYFDPSTVERVLDTLDRALAPSGALLLGAADRLCRPPSRRPSARAPARARPAPARAGWRAARPAPRRPAAAAAPAEGTIAQALAAADGGRLDEAAAIVDRILAADPLDADAHFIRGIAELGRGEAAAAVTALRRALYLDPEFGFAAFKLARAYDQLGDAPAARRAYLQALRALSSEQDAQRRLAVDVDLADIAAACGARIAALAHAS